MGCGASTAGGPPSLDEKAKAKAQRLERAGGSAMSEDQAATKIAAMRRGSSARAEVDEMKRQSSRQSARFGSAASEEDEAAMRLGAVARGRKERMELDKKNNAAASMQARVRGKSARRQVEAIAIEREIVKETAEAKLKRNKSGSSVTQVNEYYLGKMLGKGAFGQVFKAAKGGKNSDDVCAVKMLSRSILRRKRVGRFGSAYDSVMGEIAVMKALDHPNVRAAARQRERRVRRSFFLCARGCGFASARGRRRRPPPPRRATEPTRRARLLRSSRRSCAYTR